MVQKDSPMELKSSVPYQYLARKNGHLSVFTRQVDNYICINRKKLRPVGLSFFHACISVPDTKNRHLFTYSGHHLLYTVYLYAIKSFFSCSSDLSHMPSSCFCKNSRKMPFDLASIWSTIIWRLIDLSMRLTCSGSDL